MAQPPYVIRGNLSEAQIEADVASYFSWCTPLGGDRPLRLVDVNEQITGADKMYDSGCAIYMQFKKSTGLRSAEDIAVSTRSNRSRMEDIRHFRSANELEDDPTLFFQLRRKADKAHHLQHNVLLSHEQMGYSRAFYVAPLELSKSKYYQTLFNQSSRFSGDPVWYKPHMAIREKFLVRYLNWSPYLREHVAITPHEHVHDHHHFYSYSQTGTDVCWHSPKIVSEGPSRLSDVMSSIVDRAISTPGESLGSVRRMYEETLEVSSQLGFDIRRSEGMLETIQAHGRLLESTYGIRQFVLLANTEELKDFRDDF